MYFMIFSVVCNALYFYYVAAVAEFSKEFQGGSHSGPNRFDWSLTAVQQSIFYSLWFWMPMSWRLFGFVLSFLYCTYLLWDKRHWEQLRLDWKKKGLFWFDLVGLLLVLVMLFLTWSLPPFGQQVSQAEMHLAAWVTVFAAMSGVVCLGGIVYCWFVFQYKFRQLFRMLRYNPFTMSP